MAVVSPDQGGVERAQIFAENFFHSNKVDIAVIEKRRNLEKIHQSKALNLYGDVKGKTVIIVDDIVTSGRTLINGSEHCLSEGAKEIYIAVVHHELSKETSDKLNISSVSRFFSTDTIPLDDDVKFPKLEESSVAEIIAGEIKSL